mgnify:CR=1 FL=1
MIYAKVLFESCGNCQKHLSCLGFIKEFSLKTPWFDQ